jgi:hypothetical protein
LDRAGGLHPSVERAPVLRVVVDTAPPNLQLRATRGGDGQITAQWEIQDTNLKPESLILQYRTAPTQPWQAVAVDQQNSRYAGPVLTGEVTWWPNATSGTIQVRAEVIDAAGNPAVSHAQVQLDAGVPAQFTAQTNVASPAKATPMIVHEGRDPAADASNSLSDRLASLAHGVVPYVVRSLRFELDFDPVAANRLGPARTEVWCTPDEGASWRLWTVSETSRSPVCVQVPAPGTYGFRLAFRNAAGQGDPPPQGGDRPDCLIRVDPTPPSGHIRDVRPIAQ